MCLEALFLENDETLEGDLTLAGDIPPISSLECDEEELLDIQPRALLEEVKERKWLKILTTNKLWTRLLVLLAQIKAGDNWYKLKTKLNKYYIFCINLHVLYRLITII